MPAVLVSIEGTIGDHRARQSLAGSPDFYKREELLKDSATPDSAHCLQELAQKYKIVYLGRRPAGALAATEEWLRAKGFPPGPVCLAPTQEERLALARELKDRFDFSAGIGTGWEDNELHLEIGCRSILLKEHEGHWDTVRKHLLGREHTALQAAAALLAPWAARTWTSEAEPHRLDVELAPADLAPAVQALHDTRWGYLTAITGLDHPPAAGNGSDAGRIEVLYHFCHGAAVVTLRVSLPRDDARIGSVCSAAVRRRSGQAPGVSAAGFFERELSEMFGVTVVDLPDASRLFLPDDWPAGVYPLRKDFVAPDFKR